MIKLRYFEQDINDICFSSHKMAFVSGPRQCGKTTMAKHMLKVRGTGLYYNWDEIKFRRMWTQDPSQIIPEKAKIVPMVILDEIHKAKLWKRNLKGIYDTLTDPCDILVTGSARLNTYRKGSDSLMGRYYHFLLHPFSLAELIKSKISFDLVTDLFAEDITSIRKSAKEKLNLLDKFGPFPEPFLASSERNLNLWQKNRIEKIIREDLRDLSKSLELSQIEMLASLLPTKVASPLSIQSLSRDLEVTHMTVRRWLGYLQDLYYHYEIKPYTKSLPRAIKKMGKIYLWDWSEIEDSAARFENLVASHLLKYVNYLTDVGYGKYELKFLKSRDQKEIDFLIVKNNKPLLPIEVKTNSEKLSSNWKYFLSILPCKQGVQVLQKPGVYKKITTEYGEILLISAEILLSILV